MNLFMSRESSLSETSSATTLVASASAMSALADSIFSCVSFTLAVKSSSDTVVALIVLEVGPVDAEDAGGMVVEGGGGMVVTGVDEVEKLFSVVGSEMICCCSEVTLMGPAKILS